MTDKQLKETIEDLHRELARVGEVDESLGHLLEGIRGDIDQVLERASPQGLPEKLEEAVERFEATHPRLSAALGALLDQLARLGI